MTTHTSSSSSLGTATATAGQVNLDLQLLGGLLSLLHLPGTGLDVPLANLTLGQAVAPNASGDAANFTSSVLRLRDNLISELHLPGPEANLLDADAVSGTARVLVEPGGFTQAYATVTNLRLFLPIVNLPGADPNNGILKIDAVSAQATCVPGQHPSASAKMPTTILLLGHEIPVPLSGDIPLNLGVVTVDLHLSPTTVTSSSGASAAVEAKLSLDAVGLADVSGSIVLASAACTMPDTPTTSPATTPQQPGTTSAASAGGSVPNSQSGQPSALDAAGPAAQGTATGGLPDTGMSAAIRPLIWFAVVAIVVGAGLIGLRRRRS